MLRFRPRATTIAVLSGTLLLGGSIGGVASMDHQLELAAAPAAPAQQETRLVLELRQTPEWHGRRHRDMQDQL